MQNLQDLFLSLISIQFAVMIILFYFFILKPNQHAKIITKQKAAEDRAAQREADNVLGEYPTFSRHCTDEFFEDTELAYSLKSLPTVNTFGVSD